MYTDVFKKKVIATAIASITLGSLSHIALAQDKPVEEVLVRGIKSSLEKAIDIKRESVNMVEAISADDIGKMPDQNVAESLQRLPGIQIDRNNGEGTKVRIRGLDQNATLLNGNVFVSGLEYFQLGEAKTEFDSSLEGIPSELLGGVEVYKTPKASMIEGGMGGVVNLKTRDAFSLNGPLVAVNVKADQGLDAKDTQPSGSIIIGNNWDSKFAAIIALTANKKTVHNDSFQSFSREGTAINCTDNGEWDIELSRCSAGDAYLVPGMYYATDSEQERERQGASVNLQWNVNEAVQLGFDWFHADMEVSNRQYTVKHAMNTDNATGIDESQPYELENKGLFNIIKKANFTIADAEVNSAGEVSKGSADNFALRAKVDNGGKFRISTEVSYAQADLEQRAGYSDSRFTPYRTSRYVGTDLANGGTPNGWGDTPANPGTGESTRSYNYVAGSRPSLAFTNDAWLTNPDFYAFKSHWALGADVDNEAKSFRTDLEYDIDVGHLKKLTFGFRWSEQEVDFRELRHLTDFSRTTGAQSPNTYNADGSLNTATTFNPNNAPGPGDKNANVREAVYYDLCGNGGIPQGKVCDIDGDGLDDNQPYGPWGYFIDAGIGLKAFDLKTSSGMNLAEALYGSAAVAGDANRWSRSPGVIPWETYNQNPQRFVQLNNFFPSGGYRSDVLMDNANLITANVDGWIKGLTPNSPGEWMEVPLESWSIKEQTTALYVEADFTGDTVPYDLNLGLRVVKTEVDVTSAETTPESSLWSLATDGWNSQGVLLTWDVVTKTKDYWDVLPSLNFVLNTTDDSKLRFSAAKVISRPNYQDLGKGFGKNFTRVDEPYTYFAFTGGSTGNPDLDPYRATQADVSYEWYYDDLGYVSAGVFVKAVDSFLAGQTTLEYGVDTGPNGGSMGSVARTVNGTGGSVSGFEFAMQKAWENGFGVTFNYTFSNSKADVTTTTHQDLGLPGVSENSFNVIGFFENDQLSARVAYTWRDEYLSPFRSAYGVIGLENGVPEFFEAYGQWDASVTYDINANFSLTAEAINITGESQSSYLGYKGQSMTYTSQEPRLVLGVSYRM
ncbi:TonB-dependent receptor domain-containing protein [Cellvibrio polysaccharolyticus]|uniref:TonB-dependent receptor n=1 Tax=Cellvibrio polysaccharolyticus TaxID=2082724 RepID=A0A928V0G4_9GAMM|nr:TonB-dependent receptor [Cellvibrio polysaccharolyticus]MBE8716560.1 hypothetical protein [Cellvibrio polysaccharolyticus]